MVSTPVEQQIANQIESAFREGMMATSAVISKCDPHARPMVAIRMAHLLLKISSSIIANEELDGVTAVDIQKSLGAACGLPDRDEMLMSCHDSLQGLGIEIIQVGERPDSK